ncbi:MAG: patatin [Calditrichaeota bacterium]|nr:MAG: patatin [Calditrichota bacterium]
MIKLGLALGGGGARGLAHIGVLKVLEKEGVPINCIVGSSMGAIIGGAYAYLQDARAVEELAINFIERPIFQELDLLQFMAMDENLKLSRLDHLLTHLKIQLSFLKTFNHPSIFGKEIVEQLFEPYPETKIETLPVQFTAIATDLRTGEEIFMDSGSLKQAILASSAIPGVFPPVPRGRSLLIDGNASDSVPVHVLKERGAECVVAVDVTKDIRKIGPLTNALHILYRADEIVSYHLTQKRLHGADLIIRPAGRKISWANFKHVRKIIHQGEQAAQKMLAEIMKKLTPGET